jgi:tartrate-resistant acid phosphatase type 5
MGGLSDYPTMNLRLPTLLVAALAAILSVGCTEPEPEKGAYFMVIGDWGRSPKDEVRHTQQREVAGGMAATVRATGKAPVAVISVGDNFYSHSPANPHDLLFRTGFEDVYSDPALQVPFWAALGNHDYYKSVNGILVYAKEGMGSGRLTMPSRYWSRTFEAAPGVRAKVVVIDTNPFIKAYAKGHSDAPLQDRKAQLAWLDKELAEPGVAWRIVVGHHPFWSSGPHGNRATVKAYEAEGRPWKAPVVNGVPEAIVDMQTQVLPLLRRHKVQLYLCGHDHHAEVVRDGGLTQVLSGNASEARKAIAQPNSLYVGQHLGFATLGLGADKAVVRQRDEDGRVVFEVEVAR